MLSAFLKVCGIFILMILSCFLVDQFVKAWVLEEEMSEWTECEKLCYPNAVEEEIQDKKCLCLPEIKEHK
jgi:hypothetical protein